MTRAKRSKAKSNSDQPLIVNGWQVFAHPLLLDQLEKLIAAVEADKKKHPKTHKNSANTKVLAALNGPIFKTIPDDPTRKEYRHGGTLGEEYRHWFRAKFGNGRFRLFFRYSSSIKVIVFAWVNNETTLREYGARTDAYAAFARMLEKGNPPDDWDALLRAGKAAQQRLAGVKGNPSGK